MVPASVSSMPFFQVIRAAPVRKRFFRETHIRHLTAPLRSQFGLLTRSPTHSFERDAALDAATDPTRTGQWMSDPVNGEEHHDRLPV